MAAAVGITAPAAGSAALVREAVGVFDDLESLQAAVDDLQSSGFSRTDLSTLARFSLVETQLGRGGLSVREVEDEPRVPRAEFVSRTSLGDAEGVMIGGSVYLAAVIAAGIGGATGASVAGIIEAVVIVGALGGLVGFGFARWLERGYNSRFAEQIRRGGIVLWVAVHSPEQEIRASEILRRHGARDVHVHEAPAD